MRKIIAAMIIFLAVVQAGAQNPEQLVNKCVQALGGEQAVQNYANYQAEGTAKVSYYGREFQAKVKLIQQERKRWAKTEMEFGSNTYVTIQAFDGKSAFADRQGTITDLPALNYQSDADHTMLNLIDPSAQFSFVKETEIDGQKAYGIEVDTEKKQTTFFINTQSFWPVEMVFEDVYFGDNNTKEKLEKRIRYGAYQEFDGILFPTQMTLYEKGEKKMEFTFTKVTFNPEISADIFKRPDQELDLRYWEERMH